jgi:hypothetical protein
MAEANDHSGRAQVRQIAPQSGPFDTKEVLLAHPNRYSLFFLPPPTNLSLGQAFYVKAAPAQVAGLGDLLAKRAEQFSQWHTQPIPGFHAHNGLGQAEEQGSH